MNVGFANMFSFRPHVEHLYYLSTLLKNAGHNVFFLTCDASVSNCYPRGIKGSSKLKECSKCILGGVRSYPASAITSIRSKGRFNIEPLDETTLDKLALSSSCTLNRTEAENDWNLPEVVAVRRSLHSPIQSTYISARQWIDDNRLDAVICFNGRMDMTRAVTYACEQAGISYVTHERTWFGDGLQLIPNANCLSLDALNKMVKEFDSKPLNKQQASIAGKLAGERFLQRNSLEWRLYNKNPQPSQWPLQGKGPKVLVLPSSKNEFAGHLEWMTEWTDNTMALDDMFSVFSIKPEQVVVRFHPNWAENIGRVSGDRSQDLYLEWVRKRGIYYIASDQKASTYDLIQQADIVVLNGGSSAVEAGSCGKQVICLGPSTYQKAGFVRVFLDKASLMRPEALTPIDPDTVIRKTLRFLYVRSHRFPQYVNHVQAIETTRYEYKDGADPERLISMLRSGKLEADDPVYADDESEEDSVVKALKDKRWGSLADYTIRRFEGRQLNIRRRPGLHWLDSYRSMFPRGDRG